MTVGNIKTCLKRYHFEIFLFFLYAAFLMVVMNYHEIWRDEMRALSYAIYADSLKDLFLSLKNEGHPGLWHIFLYFGYSIIPSVVVLKIVNYLFIVSAVFLFIFYSPFTKIQKVFFIFGYFPFFSFGVISRTYSLVTLLLFVFAFFYKNRFSRPIRYGFCIALLANTHIISLLLSIAITLALGAESIVKLLRGQYYRSRLSLYLLVGFLIACAGIILSILTLIPDSNATFYIPKNSQIIYEKSFDGFFTPLKIPSESFGIPSSSIFVILCWILYAYLFVSRPFLFLLMFAAIYSVEVFLSLYYSTPPYRIGGIVYIFLISIFWIIFSDDKNDHDSISKLFLSKWQKMDNSFKRYVNVVILLVFFLQLELSYAYVSIDLRENFSMSKEAALFIREDPRLRDSILISEPDEFAASILYYHMMPVYLPRENRFGPIVSWTRKNQTELNLDELIRKSKKISQEEGKSIVLLLQHDLSPNKAGRVRTSQGRYFSYSIESLKYFHSEFEFITKFKNWGDFVNSELFRPEDYDMYLLRYDTIKP